MKQRSYRSALVIGTGFILLGYAAPLAAQITPEQKMQAEITSAKAVAANDSLNWRAFNDLGLVYCRHARYDQAITAFKQALALHPITTVVEAEAKQEADIAAQRAALEQKRQADIARAKAVQDQQEMSNLLGMIGGIASMQGNSNIQMLMPIMETVNNQISAVPAGGVPPLSPQAQFESSLKSKSEVSGIYGNLGVAYFGKKDYQQAVAAFDTVVQLDPSRTDVLKNSAEALFYLCKYDDCIANLARYHAIAPVEPGTLLRLFAAYRALGMEAEAEKTFAAFLARQNTAAADSSSLLGLSATCLSNWRYREGLEFLNLAKEKASASPVAAAAFVEAQRRKFGMTNAVALMAAEAHSCLNELPAAITLLREAVQGGALPKAWYMLARCYDESGDSALAAEAYKKADECFGVGKTSSDYYIFVCRAANGNGEAVQAFQARLAEVALTPGSGADQWCLLAYAYEKAGRIPEALEILSRCVDVSPSYAKARQTMDRLGRQMADARNRMLAESNAALQSGDVQKALSLRAEACQLTSAGKEKEDIRRAIFQMSAGMNPPPAMTDKAQDHYLRGNVALKSAKNPADIGRALSEFQWAVFYSPWAGELYFSTSAIKKLQNRVTASVKDLKLYLAAVPETENVDDVLSRLYELEYQHEQKLRELSAAAVF